MRVDVADDDVFKTDTGMLVTHEDVQIVCVDGATLKFVTAFDDKEGWVDVLALDKEGDFVIDLSDPEHPRAKTQRLYGVITYELRTGLGTTLVAKTEPFQRSND